MPAFVKSTSRQATSFGKRGESRNTGMGTKSSFSDTSKRGFAGTHPSSLMKLGDATVEPTPIKTS